MVREVHSPFVGREKPSDSRRVVLVGCAELRSAPPTLRGLRTVSQPEGRVRSRSAQSWGGFETPRSDRRMNATTVQPLNIPRKYTATITRATGAVSFQVQNVTEMTSMFWTAN